MTLDGELAAKKSGYKILKSKHNGYYDINFYGSSAYDFKPFVVGYKDGFYQNDIQTKSLEKALQQ